MLLVLLPFMSDSVRSPVIITLINIAIVIAAVLAMDRSTISFVLALLALLLQVAAFTFEEVRYLVMSWAFGAAVYVVTLSICFVMPSVQWS